MKRFLAFGMCLLALGCTLSVDPGSSGAASAGFKPKTPNAKERQIAELNFLIVVRGMEPLLEKECTRRTPSRNCDFQIVIDDRKGQPPNAFQTVLDGGQPILGFTEQLLYDVRNRDELAFVMAHEGAHHILNHLNRQKSQALKEAGEYGALAASVGASPAAIREAQRLGAAVGALSYSQAFELEADVLGARLTRKAGFDALNGSNYFSRIPDPGNGVLNTHPPTAERTAAVRRALQ